MMLPKIVLTVQHEHLRMFSEFIWILAEAARRLLQVPAVVTCCDLLCVWPFAPPHASSKPSRSIHAHLHSDFIDLKKTGTERNHLACAMA